MCVHMLSNPVVRKSLEPLEKELAIPDQHDNFPYNSSWKPSSFRNKFKDFYYEEIPTSQETSITVNLQHLTSCFRMANSHCSWPDLKGGTLTAHFWLEIDVKIDHGTSLLIFKLCGNKSVLSEPDLIYTLEKMQTKGGRFILVLQADAQQKGNFLQLASSSSSTCGVLYAHLWRGSLEEEPTPKKGTSHCCHTDSE